MARLVLSRSCLLEVYIVREIWLRNSISMNKRVSKHGQVLCGVLLDSVMVSCMVL